MYNGLRNGKGGCIMKQKIKILLVLVSISLTLGLMSNTYSRYIVDATGDVEVKFTKWQILVNNNDITSNNSSSIDLVPVMEDNENIAPNTIAPSSKGYFDIDIDPSNTELSFDYTISLQVLNTDIPDLMITKYALLNSDYQEGDEVQITNLSENSIKGSLNYNENEALKPFTVRIYFEWFEGENESMSDVEDTEAGSKAAREDTSLQISASINFQQKL